MDADQLNVHIKANQPQHVPAGRLLGHMYYSGFLRSILSHDDYSGYPHNGGEHSLSLSLRICDLRSFVELIKERYAKHEGLADFIATINAQFTKRYPSLPAL